MHSGPGAGSLIRAAAAWNGLARQLRAAATSYRAATAVLGDAAARYIDWLDGNAARGEQAAEGSPRPPTRTGRPARRWCPRR